MRTSTTVGQFFNAVANAKHFAAGKNEGNEILTRLQLTVSGNKIVVAATNRYTAVMARVELSEPVTSEHVFLMRVEDVKRFEQLFKGKANENAALEISLTGNQIVFSGVDTTLTVEVDSEDYNYPPIRRLMPDLTNNVPNDAYVSLALGRVVELSKIKDYYNRNGAPLVIFPAAVTGKQVAFVKGDWFKGCIVPVRVTGLPMQQNYNGF